MEAYFGCAGLALKSLYTLNRVSESSILKRLTTYETSIGLLDHLAIRAVEDGVVYVRQREGSDVPVRVTIQGSDLLGLGVFPSESVVGSVNGGGVGGNGERPVDFRVFGVELGLVEVIGVRHMSSVNSCQNPGIEM